MAAGRLSCLVSVIFFSQALAAESLGSLTSFKFGPLIRLGFPHLVDIGISTGTSSGMALDLFAFPFHIPISVDSVRVSTTHYALQAGWRPWRGSFSLGVVLGFHTIRGEKSGPVEVDFLGRTTEVTATATAHTSGFYLAPTLGWHWSVLETLTISIEVGWLFPVSGHTSIDASTDDPFGQILIESLKRTDRYQQLESDARAKAERGTHRSLPYFTLIRLVWWLD